METMTITKYPYRDEYIMRDCTGDHISTSSNLESLLQFCKDSGYRARIEEKGKICWIQ